ncbi:MAG: Ni/Fe-hydrogenase cytochrome b subunit [Candidatus Promineifilaceae bacterium]|jgi:Ni/Fe-hydrogenase subunit HybB-like protein|nr:Ni/Fe-hydrogenase cytochrome b subunit [Anaerolineaceae bacterium]
MLKKIIDEVKSLSIGYYILAVIAAAGLSVAGYRLYAGLGTTTNLSKAFPWGVWISFDLSTVAFSGGAFTLAALVYVFHLHELHSAVRPTVLVGLIGYASVLLILFMDLGRWDRFYHFLIYPNLNSALFEVSWCIMLYSTILIYELSPVLLKNSRWSGAIKIIEKWTIPMVIAGVTLSTLHQSSLGTLFIVMSPRLHALWHSMLLPVFFLISSLAAGLAMVIAGAILSYWIFKRTLAENVQAELAWFIPWILSIYLVLKVGELEITDELHLLFSSGKYSTLYLTELALLVVPLILFAIKRVRHSRGWSLTGAAFVLAGVVLNRFNASWFAIKPVAGEMYSPSWMEVAILIGVLATAVLAYSLIAHYFPLFEETVPVERPPKRQPSLAQTGD